MEKAVSFIAIDGLEFPVGFRFLPTDEVLIVQYLYRKALSLPLPISAIPVVEVFRFNPADLPGNFKEKRYFFTRGREGNADNGKMVRVSDGTGFWKASGKEKKIVVSDNKERRVVGVRKTLTFFHGRRSSVGLKSSWVMHEFNLSKLDAADWRVCKIYEKKNRVKCNKRHEHDHDEQFVGKVTRARSGDIHISKQEFDRISPLPQTSSSSCSSGVTFLRHDEDEETSAAFLPPST